MKPTLDELRLLRQRAEKAEQDARRYRWMRENWAYSNGTIFFDEFDLGPLTTLDEAIDAAIGKPEPAGEETIRECGLHQALRERAEKAEQDARRYRWAVKNARWIRHEHESYVAIPVALDADLSCVAMRTNAIDAAIGKPEPAGEEPSSQK